MFIFYSIKKFVLHCIFNCHSFAWIYRQQFVKKIIHIFVITLSKLNQKIH